MFLKRAEPSVEKRVIDRYEDKLAPGFSGLKVYLKLNRNGTFKFNENGTVGMILLSDEDIIHYFSSGRVFYVPDDMQNFVF